jgi:hypothetical protein
MVRFLKLIAIFVVFASNLVAQITLERPLMAVISEMDAMERPVIFLANDDPDLRNDEASNYAEDRIGKYNNYFSDITIYVMDASQYEVCCKLLSLPNRQYKANFVLYFKGNTRQFYFDKNTDIDFLSEFSRMGWVSAQLRLENFLIQNPYNQEAISRLFSLAVRELKKQIDSGKQQTTMLSTIDDKALDDALSLFVKTLELIVEANAFEWMTYTSSIFPLFDLRSLGNAPVITENKKIQIVLTDLLELLERSIIQRPLSQQFRYMFWAGFATIMKNRPDPMIFLRNLSFPKNTSIITHMMLSAIAEQYSKYPKTNEDGEPVLSEILTFFKSAAEWMLEWDPNLDGVFSSEFKELAKIQAITLIKLQMYSELEKHLNDTRMLVGSYWSEIVNELKTNHDNDGRLDDIPQLNRKRIDAILELPALTKNINPFKGILISHNFDKESFDKLHNVLSLRKVYFPLRQNRSIPENSWSLFNSNVHVASGSINTLKDDSNSISEFDQLVELARKEEIKNLMALERLLRSYPDNYDIMDIYCEEAAKLLPDKELEQKILNYTKLTHTAPHIIAYSRMENKDDWASLTSKVIGEGLLNLNDIPFSSAVNPWLNLSDWEDLDPQKNSIDWYTFLKESVLLYQPYYYLCFYSRIQIPGVVFIKYLNQAELAGDTMAVIDACRAKFDWKKENCKSEKILAIWENAEEIMKKESSLSK